MLKRLLITALLAIFTAIPTVPSADSVMPKLLESVRPLQMPIAEMKVTAVDENGHPVAAELEIAVRNICTVSNINTVKRYWVTAAHCVDDMEAEYYIAGDEANVVMRDVKNDLAVLQTPTATAPALKLAKKGPRACRTHKDDECKVMIGGHPFGVPEAWISLGTVMHPAADIEDENGVRYMIIQAAGAPGNSGSPIVNINNQIVSVLQIGWSRSFSPVMGGVIFETLKSYAEYWN